MKLILKSLLIFLALLALMAIVRSCTRDKPANTVSNTATSAVAVNAQNPPAQSGSAGSSAVSSLSASLVPNNLEKEAAMLEASAQREAALIAATGKGATVTGTSTITALSDKNSARGFMAYYSAMGSTQAALCEQLGVPIPRFITAFAAVHRDELAFARAALGAEFTNAIPGTGVDRAEKKTSAELVDFVKSMPSELTDACKELDARADTAAAEMHISKTLPEIASMLKNKK